MWLEEDVYSATLGYNALKLPIKLIWSSVSFKAPVSLLILSWKIYPLMSWDVKIPYYDFITVSLSLYVHQDLLYIFRCSYVEFINVYKGYDPFIIM